MKYVILKAYDGTIVRVEESKVKIFNENQEKIKKLLEKGKTIEEIQKIISEENK